MEPLVGDIAGEYLVYGRKISVEINFSVMTAFRK